MRVGAHVEKTKWCFVVVRVIGRASRGMTVVLRGVRVAPE